MQDYKCDTAAETDNTQKRYILAFIDDEVA